VALAFEPSATYVATVLGVLLAGGVAVPVNTGLTSFEIEEFLAPVEPALLVTSDALLPLFARVATDFQEVELGSSVAGVATLDLRDRTESGLRAEDRPAVILGTGGTTGTPKGAVFNHRSLWLWTLSSAVNNNVQPFDTELFIAPFFHGTLITGLLTTLTVGGTVMIQPRFDAGRARDAIASGEVTRMLGATTVVERLLAETEGTDLSRARLRVLQFGMATARGDFARDIIARFPSAMVVTGFGATECGPVTRTYSWEFGADGEPPGVGRPVPGVDIRIEHEGVFVDAPGTQGEILINAPWQMQRYCVLDPTVERELGASAYFRSGDLGRFDEQGNLYIVGRIKETIRTGGETVFPTEVEVALHRHPGVVACAVYGVTDSDWGERVEAVVVRRTEGLDVPDLDAHLRNLIAGFKVPKRILFVEEIPQTSNHKIDRRALRRLAEAGGSQGS
jgi:acyl-CoA synthetase (AMP-forming)/AMP-acid ligase II